MFLYLLAQESSNLKENKNAIVVEGKETRCKPLCISLYLAQSRKNPAGSRHKQEREREGDPSTGIEIQNFVFTSSFLPCSLTSVPNMASARLSHSPIGPRAPGREASSSQVQCDICWDTCQIQNKNIYCSTVQVQYPYSSSTSITLHPLNSAWGLDSTTKG